MAANEGFQSKMSTETGSYVMTRFIQGLRDNIDNNNEKFLNAILEEIQENLHSEGTQLMTTTFNNKTGYIKFDKNEEVDLSEEDEGRTDAYNEVEMAEK